MPFFANAEALYQVPAMLLRAMALQESACRQLPREYRAATQEDVCGAMQLTNAPTSKTLTRAYDLLATDPRITGVTSEDSLCAQTVQGLQLNIYGGAAILAKDKKCWASLKVNSNEDLAACQANRLAYFTLDELEKLNATIEPWWFPVSAYNGAPTGSQITVNNYPFHVWTHLAKILPSVSWQNLLPQRSRITYTTASGRDPNCADTALPYPPYLHATPDCGYRRLAPDYYPFTQAVLHTNTGAVYGGPIGAALTVDDTAQFTKDGATFLEEGAATTDPEVVLAVRTLAPNHDLIRVELGRDGCLRR